MDFEEKARSKRKANAVMSKDVEQKFTIGSKPWLGMSIPHTSLPNYAPKKFKLVPLLRTSLWRKAGLTTVGLAVVGMLASPIVMAQIGQHYYSQQEFQNDLKRSELQTAALTPSGLVTDDEAVLQLTQQQNKIFNVANAEVTPKLLTAMQAAEGDSSYVSKLKGLVHGGLHLLHLSERGGSTLAQSVAGVISGNRQGSITQRLKEIAMESYMNNDPKLYQHIISAGSCQTTKVIGCTPAAYALFGKPVAQLTDTQIAALIATIKLPPTSNSIDRLLMRTQSICNMPQAHLSCNASEINTELFANRDNDPYQTSRAAINAGWKLASGADFAPANSLNEALVRSTLAFAQTSNWELAIFKNENLLYHRSNLKAVQNNPEGLNETTASAVKLIALAEETPPTTVLRIPHKVDGEYIEFHGDIGHNEPISTAHAMAISDNVAINALCNATLANPKAAVNKYKIKISNADTCAAISTGNALATTATLRDIAFDVLEKAKTDSIIQTIASAPLMDNNGTLHAFAPIINNTLQGAIAKTGTGSSGEENVAKVLLFAGWQDNQPIAIILRLHSLNGHSPICSQHGCINNATFIPVVSKALALVTSPQKLKKDPS